MRKYVKDFVLRGLVCAAGGPLVLAVIYAILAAEGVTDSLSPDEVSTAIISVTVMAFIAAGITMIYQIEQLPLPCAILIHGGVLYADYLLMYILNSWIPRNWQAIGIFTAVFAAGYALIWLVIYLTIRAKTERINEKLKT